MRSPGFARPRTSGSSWSCRPAPGSRPAGSTSACSRGRPLPGSLPSRSSAPMSKSAPSRSQAVSWRARRSRRPRGPWTAVSPPRHPSAPARPRPTTATSPRVGPDAGERRGHGGPDHADDDGGEQPATARGGHLGRGHRPRDRRRVGGLPLPAQRLDRDRAGKPRARPDPRVGHRIGRIRRHRRDARRDTGPAHRDPADGRGDVPRERSRDQRVPGPGQRPLQLSRAIVRAGDRRRARASPRPGRASSSRRRRRSRSGPRAVVRALPRSRRRWRPCSRVPRATWTPGSIIDRVLARVAGHQRDQSGTDRRRRPPGDTGRSRRPTTRPPRSTSTTALPARSPWRSATRRSPRRASRSSRRPLASGPWSIAPHRKSSWAHQPPSSS